MTAFLNSPIGIATKIIAAFFAVVIYYLSYCKFFEEADRGRKGILVPIYNVYAKCEIVRNKVIFFVYLISTLVGLIAISCGGINFFINIEYLLKYEESLWFYYTHSVFATFVLTAAIIIREVSLLILRMKIARAFGQKIVMQILCGFIPFVFIPITAIWFNVLRGKAVARQRDEYQSILKQYEYERYMRNRKEKEPQKQLGGPSLNSWKK